MTEETKAGQIIEYDKNDTPHFIIDRVDVSDCGFLDYHRPTKLLLCNECNSDFEAMECKDYTDCYYKQLKRLEQENAKLKEKLEQIKSIVDFNLIFPINNITKREIGEKIKSIIEGAEDVGN